MSKLDVDVDQGDRAIANYKGGDDDTSTPGQMAQTVRANPKCLGCYHYDQIAGKRHGLCTKGLLPKKCGDGSDPEAGYAPLVPDQAAYNDWKAKRGQRYTAPRATVVVPSEIRAPAFHVEVLGDSDLALSQRVSREEAEQLIKAELAQLREGSRLHKAVLRAALRKGFFSPARKTPSYHAAEPAFVKQPAAPKPAAAAPAPKPSASTAGSKHFAPIPTLKTNKYKTVGYSSPKQPTRAKTPTPSEPFHNMGGKASSGEGTKAGRVRSVAGPAQSGGGTVAGRRPNANTEHTISDTAATVARPRDDMRTVRTGAPKGMAKPKSDYRTAPSRRSLGGNRNTQYRPGGWNSSNLARDSRDKKEPGMDTMIRRNIMGKGYSSDEIKQIMASATPGSRIYKALQAKVSTASIEGKPAKGAQASTHSPTMRKVREQQTQNPHPDAKSKSREANGGTVFHFSKLASSAGVQKQDVLTTAINSHHSQHFIDQMRHTHGEKIKGLSDNQLRSAYHSTGIRKGLPLGMKRYMNADQALAEHIATNGLLTGREHERSLASRAQARQPPTFIESASLTKSLIDHHKDDVIGHTGTGKPVKVDGKYHGGFTEEEHEDAADLHNSIADKMDRMVSPWNSDGGKTLGPAARRHLAKKGQHHRQMAQGHGEARSKLAVERYKKEDAERAAKFAPPAGNKADKPDAFKSFVGGVPCSAADEVRPIEE